ncbi:MAG: hypothetical protein IJ237_04510 [Oscillospiraceae bacterium]|nr:hypothetical protein [Oscillospiraceae bacterium]
MKKAILTYLVGKEIVGFIVMAAMMIGLLVFGLIAYALLPEASAEEMNPYAGRTFTQYTDGYASQKLCVFDNGTVSLVGEDNKSVGTYYFYDIGEEGELQIFDCNDSQVFNGTMSTDGALVDDNGYLWLDVGHDWVE